MTMDELAAKIMRTYSCDEDKARELAAQVMPLIEKRRRRNKDDLVRRNSFHRNKDNRRAIYGRDEGCCAMCGKPITFEEMTLGHRIPVASGGKSSWENSQAECGPCNVRKGDRNLPRLSFSEHGPEATPPPEAA